MARGVAGAIQRLMHFFLPKEEDFFVLFATMSEHAHQGSLVLRRLYQGKDDMEALRESMAKIENDVDDLKHECIRRLHNTFVTPILFDRQDILDVADELDSVVDFTRAAVDRTVLYRVEGIPEAARALADVLVEATEALSEACKHLAKLRSTNAHFIETVNELENKGDGILKQGLAHLFLNEKNAIEIIKWKEIFDYIEEAIDHTEDTVNSIEAALVKNS